MVQNSIPPSDPKSHAIGLMLGAMLALLLPSTGWAASCGDNRPAQLRMATEPPRPEYRHQLTRAQLGALKAGGRASSDRNNAGLTHSQTALNIVPMVEARQMSNGTLCVVLRQADVSWRMAQFLVDIAAEYRSGSCPYKEIVRHEGQHVEIAQRAFAEADRALRQRLVEAVRRQEPFVFRGTPQQAAQAAGNQLMAVARPILEQYDRDTQRQNAAIDTPESYRAVTARCRDW